MLPEDDRVFETCRSFVNVLMQILDLLNIYIQGVTGGTDQTSGGCSLC